MTSDSARERPAVRRAIIVAAGRGQRLMPYTDEMPKCMVPLDGRPLVAWQLHAMRQHGLDEFVLVRGYKAEVLAARQHELGPGIQFVDNRDWPDNNILLSLFHASSHLDGPLLVSYGDIVYTPEVITALLAAPGEICLVVDRAFAQVYEGRTDHPLTEAEVCDLDEVGNIRRVGKRSTPADQAWGEFIGLLKLSATGTRWLRQAWDELSQRYVDRPDAPFQRAARFRQAYLTDMLQHLVDQGIPITPVPIQGGWREIDTVQDLERARGLLDSAGGTGHS
jgi:choline kinase